MYEGCLVVEHFLCAVVPPPKGKIRKKYAKMGFFKKIIVQKHGNFEDFGLYKKNANHPACKNAPMISRKMLIFCRKMRIFGENVQKNVQN